MRLEKLRVYLETSPAMRLLRSPNAAFILEFLYRQFKDAGRITRPLSELHTAMLEYQDDIHEPYPDVLRDKPEVYLSTWCSGESRWLHRFLEVGTNEPLYQLTPHTEDVFVFLDRVLQQDLGFVGTDSRLRLVIDMLADLVIGASDDPEVRLTHLREERAWIDAEIERVEREGVEARYESTMIRERFATAIGLLKQLLGDFRAVEERFKEITKQVQARQHQDGETRGGILEFALDAEDVLKEEDQGISFYEFVRFILSPMQQERLHSIMSQLVRIRDLAEQAEGLATVRRMIPLLLAEAEKVMRTNQRLSATLRRLLSVESFTEHRQVSELLREIKSYAASLATDPPRESVGISVDCGVDMSSPFARTFWSEPSRFDLVDLSEHVADDDRRAALFQMLAQLHRLDWRAMRDHIRSAVARHGSLTLGQVVSAYPPSAGVVELLGYLQIANDDGHLISRDSVERIVLDAPRPDSAPRTLTIPLVTFVSTEDRVVA